MKQIYSVLAIATVLLSIQMVSAQIFIKRQSKAPFVTTVQVQALLADSKNSGRFVIVDVRDKVETDVSIIPGAITRAEFERTQQDNQGKAVIVFRLARSIFLEFQKVVFLKTINLLFFNQREASFQNLGEKNFFTCTNMAHQKLASLAFNSLKVDND